MINGINYNKQRQKLKQTMSIRAEAENQADWAYRLVACRYCGATKGYACLGINGQDRKTPHPSRLSDAGNLSSRVDEALRRQKAKRRTGWGKMPSLPVSALQPQEVCQTC